MADLALVRQALCGAPMRPRVLGPVAVVAEIHHRGDCADCHAPIGPRCRTGLCRRCYHHRKHAGTLPRGAYLATVASRCRAAGLRRRTVYARMARLGCTLEQALARPTATREECLRARWARRAA